MHGHDLLAMNWGKIFIPTMSIPEIVVRGSIFYLSIVLLLRFGMKRHQGEIGMADLLLLVLLGDASQNAMVGSYTSVTDGIVLISTLVAWSYFLNWLAFHVPVVEKILSPAPITLVRDGRMLRDAMRRQLITERELNEQLRLEGVQDIADVERAEMESSGQVSIIKRRRAGRRAAGTDGLMQTEDDHGRNGVGPAGPAQPD